MPPFGPIKRGDLILYLKRAHFEGPRSGAKHQFMVKSALKIRRPNPHRGDVSKELLSRLLSQARISREEWERL